MEVQSGPAPRKLGPDDIICRNPNCGYIGPPRRCREEVQRLAAFCVSLCSYRDWYISCSRPVMTLCVRVVACTFVPGDIFNDSPVGWWAMSHHPNKLVQPKRKHPAHEILVVEGQPTIIFDTVCTKNREPWLADEAVHSTLREVWRDATAWLVGRYVIMPDHVHFFAAATDASTVTHDKWVTYWKSQFSKRHRVPSHRWQTDCWDTRIRSATAYEEKWEYVRYNPVRRIS